MTHLLAGRSVFGYLVVMLATVWLSASPSLAADPPATVEAAVQAKIDRLSEEVVRPAEQDALKVFYADRSYRPVWFDRTGPTRAAQQVTAELMKASDWGLDAADFPLLATRTPMADGKWTVAQAAAAEFELSASILKYARQARGGRIAEPDRLLSSYLDRHPTMPEPGDVLRRVALAPAPDDALRSYQPQHEQFQKLHDLYVKTRAAQSAAPVAEVPLRGPVLTPGIKHPDVALLRRRLNVTVAAGRDDVYDQALLDAVKAFQASTSLNDDGIVGQLTRKALHSGGSGHLGAIAATMEQWRWMPSDLGDKYLLVNVPAYSIDLVEHGNSVFTERVITGKSSTQTPIFSKQLTAIVLKPLWYLPDSIKLEKLLSAQRSGIPIEGEGYIVKKGRRVVESSSVDWNHANLRDYSIYQPSGESNALGDVKFLFPNKHAVYLHDTPNKSLFAAADRQFSHGCVRLRNPLALAQRLLDDDEGAGVWNVKSAVRRVEANTEVLLKTPVPIHIGYFSVWIGQDGTPRYFGDPYGHDQRISLALAGKWDAIDKGVDHLAAVDTRALKTVRLQSPAQLAAARDGQLVAGFGPNGEPPMGLFNSASPPAAKSSKYFAPRRDGGVGDIIRAKLVP
jgi:murein L,D-transpeptidase YcbB/YkuD